MATLILASGVPMITAGDELGRTQQGNNNAYCQDSPISWVHWDTQATWSDQTELTRKLLQLRAEHAVFRRDGFRHGEFLLDPKGRAMRTEEHCLVRRSECRDDRAGLARRHATHARHVPRVRRPGPNLRRGIPDLVPRRFGRRSRSSCPTGPGPTPTPWSHTPGTRANCRQRRSRPARVLQLPGSYSGRAPGRLAAASARTSHRAASCSTPLADRCRCRIARRCPGRPNEQTRFSPCE